MLVGFCLTSEQKYKKIEDDAGCGMFVIGGAAISSI